jgi:hypothetical protein
MSYYPQDEIESVDFYAAIQAHVLWRVRLEAYVEGTSNEELNPNTVGRDDCCALGKWIHGPGGMHYGTHPRFPDLKNAHACFHKAAGEVIRCVDSGDSEKARELLLRGKYTTCSHEVKSHLAKLGLETENAVAG